MCLCNHMLMALKCSKERGKKPNPCSHRCGVWNVSFLMPLKEDNCAKSILRKLSGRLAQTMSALAGARWCAWQNSYAFAVCLCFTEDVWKNTETKADENSESFFNRIKFLQIKAWLLTILMIKVILRFLKGEIFPFVFEVILEEIWVTVRLGFGKHFSYFFQKYCLW